MKKIIRKLLCAMIEDRPLNAAREIHEDATWIEVPSQRLKFEIYRKKLHLGTGVAVVVHVADKELLRLDCFGGDQGHLHASLGIRYAETVESRLWFRETTIPDQIDRSIFELRKNLAYYLQRSPLREARNLDLTQSSLVAALGKVEPALRNLATTLPMSSAST